MPPVEIQKETSYKTQEDLFETALVMSCSLSCTPICLSPVMRPQGALSIPNLTRRIAQNACASAQGFVFFR